jgi:hypothetical protein
MRLITRGLGGGQGSGMILQGMTEVVRIIRAGRTIAKDIYTNLLEEFTIAAKLLEINGKEILTPIFNRRKYMIDESIEHEVNVKNVSVQKRKDQSKANVFAEVLNISRGSNG